MVRGAKLLTGVSIIIVTACSTGSGAIHVRPMSNATAVAVAVPDEVAEARAQFALGNTGLAHELFRKALREEPDSVDAHAGIAACYERMGRFDLARRYYESALARAPGDVGLLERFASVLDSQGLRAEAGAVRAEIQDRRSATLLADLKSSATMAPEASAVPATVRIEQAPAAPVQAAAAPSRTVTVQLPAAEAAPVTTAARPSKTPEVKPAQPEPRVSFPEKPRPDTLPSLRLERLSPAEVALVSGSVWKSQLVAQSRVSTTVRFVPLRNSAGSVGAVRLLNAARHQGLAAQTRNVLIARGWRRIAIGDAPSVRSTSVVLYPQSRRRTGLALAAQFGMTAAERASGSEIIMLLGRDAVHLQRRKDRA